MFTILWIDLSKNVDIFTNVSPETDCVQIFTLFSYSKQFLVYLKTYVTHVTPPQ